MPTLAILIPNWRYLDFIAVTDGAQNGWFMVEDSDYGLIVWAQEAGMLVDVYDSKGCLVG